MPTLRKRTDTTETHHPRQTSYYIVTHLPDVGFVTYQIDPRAVEFLTEVCGYADGDDLPWSVVHPLRQIRDLYTLEEGRPRTADPDDAEVTDVGISSIDRDERAALVEYLEAHPDVVGDIGEFATRLERGDGSYTGVLKREGYTPAETPGFGTTSNKALDRIAERYFGDETDGYITWNGERVYDYVQVTDRDGNVHQFPEIESRLPEGERLRLNRDLYERWGPEIGESEVNSRRYDPDEEGFPNRWIGQREGSPEPTLGEAESPRAFYYRTIAGRSNHAPGEEAEAAFEKACEYSLEVYKANFPIAVDPGDLRTEYVTVEEATEPWNDFQVPPGWAERYAENGGLPPLKRDLDSELTGYERFILERHSPGGDGTQWFTSTAEGRELLTDNSYRGVLLAAEATKYDVVDFSRGGAGEPVFEVSFNNTTATIVVDDAECQICVSSPSGTQWQAGYDGSEITEWYFDANVGVSEAAMTLVNFGVNLSDATDFADAVLAGT